jgi:hypothetical protein
MTMRYYLAPLAAAVLALWASDAFALKFDMGTHGSDVIKSARSKSGGTYSQGSGGYGCEYSNGGEVLCDNKTSKCTGWTNLQQAGHGAGRMGLDNAMKAIAASPQGGGALGSHGNMTSAAPLGASEASVNTRATTATSPLNSSGGTVMTRGTLTKQPH